MADTFMLNATGTNVAVGSDATPRIHGQEPHRRPNGIMDLLWTKPDGTAQYWKLNATGVPTAKVSYPPL